MTRNTRIAEISASPAMNTAAYWFDRLQNEELAPEEIASWQKWLCADASHQQAFDELQDTWQRFEGMEAPELPGKAQLAADEYVGLTSVAEWVQRRQFDLRRLQREGHRRVWPLAVAAALIALVCGTVLVGVRWHSAYGPVTAIYETQGAEHREFQLPDGSALSLGAKTLVWIEFGRGRRDLVLERGEAFFKVAQDRERPFVVRVGDSQVTALGTAFNIRRTDGRTLVTVAEGVVGVSLVADATPVVAGSIQRARPAERQLHAGQQVVVDKEATMLDPGTAAGAATAWRTGRLEYLNEPLRYVVADVNRYSKTEIVIQDAAVGDLLVTGTVLENDVEGWLRSLGEFMPVRVERTGEDRVVLRSRTGR